MKKIFVITDNKFMYEKIRNILKNKNVVVDFFCSYKSKENFKSEIDNNRIRSVNLKDSLCLENLLKENYEIGFSCHSKQIFPYELVDSVLCINIHPGYNPYNRGWFPQVFSIINKLPIGATIHIMDKEIDHGDIIAQEEIIIEAKNTSLDVYNKVLKKELELLEKNIDNILNNSFNREKPKKEGNYNSIKDYKELCKIDLNKKVTMKEAIDYLRAMTHPPYKNAYFIDENSDKVYVSISLKKF